ncbi:alanine acetyltransferase [Corynebacterium phocae]|uniref:[Ribosomal protein bS18]-alanine N-acetyltransferase n=1 Tax=Corynebacterium phocae TaxID=161895 RepID=A0A1L7D569_9CORY|nr:ribosomal protein S18-alanine N-acetyltransferase [Corynebacterium phocae]APT93191.1 alanine acetyltransferase [Corynebacterium phocae]KAA8721927.1 ribosomal-protein-alanine N-acetyltransferase [Corynebacterium phocae]
MLRELGAKDAARCAELEKVLFPGETPWSEEVFLADFPQPHTFYFGYEKDGQLVGYAGLAMMGPAADPEFEILTIGVDPAAQRQGVGRAMMDNICHIADIKKAPVFLEVRVGNSPAIKMYEAYGFEKIGLRRNYYQPSGADAHVMKREGKS